ncbi:MAG: Ni/Fe hydrogenase subunit alpha, partial [Candidatus Buchananbacteria bacterium]
MKIQINHIGKMEGHTDFVAEILKGDVKSAKLMTTEGARLIEGILIGRHFSEAPIITSRICGICPVVHKLSSIKAIENALKIKPTEQTTKLRKILSSAQIIHSHALHLFFLSLPDFFDIEDDLNFVKEHTKEAKAAINVREWALKVIEIIGGRAVHPINCEVGGFKVTTDKVELQKLLSQYEDILKSAFVLVHFVLKVKYPLLKRPTKYISMVNENEYATYSGDIKILNENGTKKIIKANKFTKNIKEVEDPYRAAKSAELDHQPFMVGAIARINNNHAQLNPLAKGLIKGLHWKLPQYNPFANISAQAIEIVHYLEESKKLLTDIIKNLKPEQSASEKLKIIAGANPLGKEVSGSDAVEAPRGTLYHHYVIDKDGYIKSCQIITPTVSYLKNLEEDIMVYLPRVMDMPADKRAKKIRALIRAYDPCISCATH